MGKKITSNLFTMIFVLLVITGLSAFALAIVNNITAENIQKSRNAKKIEGISKVVPPFSNNPVSEMFKVELATGDSLEVFPAKNNNVIVGYAIASKTQKGFSGLVRIMVGFTPEGKVYNTFVLQHSETPGLGDKMEDPEFQKQFINIQVENTKMYAKKQGGDVDAITAATISSNAFADAVSNAYTVFKKIASPSQAVKIEPSVTKEIEQEPVVDTVKQTSDKKSKKEVTKKVKKVRENKVKDTVEAVSGATPQYNPSK